MGRKKFGADLTIIIPAAGVGRRMKSHGPKPLTQISQEDTILSKQLKLLTKEFPRAEFIVVVGFQAEKIIKHLTSTPFIKIVENELHEETSVVRSIGMALRIASNPHVLIVYSDLLFNSDTLTHLTTGPSTLIVDSHGQFTQEEVGVHIISGFATSFAYGLKTKWGQIIFLTDKELQIFRSIACNREKRKLNTFEVLNRVVDAGGQLKTLEPPNMKIIEIDSTKDIENARKISW